METRNIYFDTETTSTHPGQICQLSAIIEDSNTHSLLGTTNYFFTVDSMDPGAEAVHGLSLELLSQLSGGYKFADRVDEVYNLFNGALLIGHNVAFDIKFLSMEFWRCGISYVPYKDICTMKMLTNIIKIPRRQGGYKYSKLAEVIDYFGISVEKLKEYTMQMFHSTDDTIFHDARFDTTALYVIVNIIRESKNGQNNWTNTFCRR